MDTRTIRRRRRTSLLMAVLFGVGCRGMPSAHAAFPSGRGEMTADLSGAPIQVFTYRPDGCAITGFILVFHGLARDASRYRDHAMPVGERLCMLVVAPLFDSDRFPTWRYQRGGVVHHGSVVPVESQTVTLVPRLVAWVRAQEKQADLPYDMLGHSAGGQFLARVAAFVPNDARRVVIANPSTWVWPSLEIAAPYGFGGVYDRTAGEAALRRYLASPVTVLLGQADTGAENLVTGAAAEAQGTTRLERGQNVFRFAEATAHQHGWTFNWRLAVVPEVGHNARRMFASEQALAALRP